MTSMGYLSTIEIVLHYALIPRRLRGELCGDNVVQDLRGDFADEECRLKWDLKRREHERRQQEVGSLAAYKELRAVVRASRVLSLPPLAGPAPSAAEGAPTQREERTAAAAPQALRPERPSTPLALDEDEGMPTFSPEALVRSLSAVNGRREELHSCQAPLRMPGSLADARVGTPPRGMAIRRRVHRAADLGAPDADAEPADSLAATLVGSLAATLVGDELIGDVDDDIDGADVRSDASNELSGQALRPLSGQSQGPRPFSPLEALAELAVSPPPVWPNFWPEGPGGPGSFQRLWSAATSSTVSKRSERLSSAKRLSELQTCSNGEGASSAATRWL